MLGKFSDGTVFVKQVDLHDKCLYINRKYKPGITMGKCRTYIWYTYKLAIFKNNKSVSTKKIIIYCIKIDYRKRFFKINTSDSDIY